MKPELLAPAGDWPSLRGAIQSGANAIYFGINFLNMRANAKNFKIIELKKIVDLCHTNRVKVYLTLNTIIYDKELKRAEQVIIKAKQANIDAIICWDLSIIQLAKKYNIPFHISTQASVSNSNTAKFYKQLGANRIILARELNLKQIKQIAKIIDVEVFAHGALCYSISGRCFFSQDLYSKSANRGECIQPCRRKYLLTDPETGKQIQAENNYFLSPKDLCTLPFLNKLISAGIKAIKIEGRNRPPEYVKTVVKVYREALDNPRADKNKLLEKLKAVYNRNFSSGFYLGLPTSDDITNLYGSAATEKKSELGVIINYYKKPKVAAMKIIAGEIKIGDTILILGNKTGMVRQEVKSLEINQKKVKEAKKGQLVGFPLDSQVRPNDKVYKITRRNL